MSARPAPPILGLGLVVVVDGAGHIEVMTTDVTRCLATARSSAALRGSEVLVVEGRCSLPATAWPVDVVDAVIESIIGVTTFPSTGRTGPVSGSMVAVTVVDSEGPADATSVHVPPDVRPERTPMATLLVQASPRKARLVRRKGSA